MNLLTRYEGNPNFKRNCEGHLWIFRKTNSFFCSRTHEVAPASGVVSEIMRNRVSLGNHEETFPLPRNMPALPRSFPVSPHGHGFVQQEEGILQ